MAKYTYVTSFNNKLWKGYAKDTVPSVYLTRPDDSDFLVYYDGNFNPDWQHAMPKAEFISLDSMANYKHFLARWGHMKAPPNVPDGHKFRFNWKPFWAKVCAIRSAMKLVNASANCLDNKGSNCLVWVDADVVSDKKVTEEILDGWIDDASVATLVRGAPWNTWDSGFMILKLWSASRFVEEVYETYTSGRIFDYNEWHDAYIFTVVYKSWKDRIQVSNLNMQLSAAHPFDSSVLPPYYMHLKGPRKNTRQIMDPKGLNGVFLSTFTGVRNVKDDTVMVLGKDGEIYEANQ